VNSLNNINDINFSNNIITFTTPCFIKQINKEDVITIASLEKDLPFNALIDTGALNSNYISNDCFNKIKKNYIDNNDIVKCNKKL
jgi:hypothetical protein